MKAFCPFWHMPGHGLARVDTFAAAARGRVIG